MQENNFSELRNGILNQLIVLNNIENELMELVKKQKFEEITPLKEKYQTSKLKSQLEKDINDWNKHMNSLEIIAENIDFIKESKQFLSQFEDNTLEINQLILGEIEKLEEKRQKALTDENFKLAGNLLDKIVALKQKVQ